MFTIPMISLLMYAPNAFSVFLKLRNLHYFNIQEDSVETGREKKEQSHALHKAEVQNNPIIAGENDDAMMVVGFLKK